MHGSRYGLTVAPATSRQRTLDRKRAGFYAWTENDDLCLEVFWRMGIPIEDIAVLLWRAPAGIAARVSFLELPSRTELGLIAA